MAFFQSLFSRPAAPPAPRVTFQVPTALPKISAPAASDVAVRAGHTAPGLPSASLSPTSYLAALLQQQKLVEAVGFLAHGLPPRDAVRWAVDSCAVVSAQQSPQDRQATEASKAWLAQPTEANRQQAIVRAAEAGHAGPGAWAAQAAGWAGTPAGPATTNAVPDLVGKAVTGSVMLAAAMTKPGFTLPKFGAAPAPVPTLASPSLPLAVVAPVPNADELSTLYKPFLDRGVALAAGAT